MPPGDPSIPEPSAEAGEFVRLDPDEELWEPLLLSIEEGRVVPIIGRDLLTITVGGRQVLLYAWLADWLSQALKVDVASIAGPATRPSSTPRLRFRSMKPFMFPPPAARSDARPRASL